MKNILIYLLLIVSSYSVLAQNQFPLTITSSAVEASNLKWSNLYTDPNFFKLEIITKNNQQAPVQFFLKIKIEKAGLIIETKPQYIPKSLLKVSFEKKLHLSGVDLAHYFDNSNIEIKGVDSLAINSLKQSGFLPDGFYNITTTAYSFNADRSLNQLSNVSFCTISNSYGYPPVITFPTDNQTLPDNRTRNLMFQWKKMYTIDRGDAPEYVYDVWLSEADSNEDPIHKLQSKDYFFHTTTSNTTLQYLKEVPQLTPGKKYAIQIRINCPLNERALFKNDGYSNPVKFYYGGPCLPTTSLRAETYKSQGVRLYWPKRHEAIAHELTYRLKANVTDEWKTIIVNANNYNLNIEQPIENYYFKIRSQCSNNRLSEYYSTTTDTNPRESRLAVAFNAEVLNPFEIIVSSDRIPIRDITNKIDELKALNAENQIRCGFEVSKNRAMIDSASNINTNENFKVKKGNYLYKNGYEILVSKDTEDRNEHTGEGLLFVPSKGMRIPVKWGNQRIFKAKDGDFGCLSEKVTTFNSSDVNANYIKQIIALLTDDSMGFSGTLGEALKKSKDLAETLKPMTPPNSRSTEVEKKIFNDIMKQLNSTSMAIENGVNDWENLFWINYGYSLSTELDNQLASVIEIKDVFTLTSACTGEELSKNPKSDGRYSHLGIANTCKLPLDSIIDALEKGDKLMNDFIKVAKNALIGRIK